MRRCSTTTKADVARAPTLFGFAPNYLWYRRHALSNGMRACLPKIQKTDWVGQYCRLRYRVAGGSCARPSDGDKQAESLSTWISQIGI